MTVSAPLSFAKILPVPTPWVNWVSLAMVVDIATRPAADVDQADIEAMFIEDASVFGDPGRQRRRAHGGIANANAREIFALGRAEDRVRQEEKRDREET